MGCGASANKTVTIDDLGVKDLSDKLAELSRQLLVERVHGSGNMSRLRDAFSKVVEAKRCVLEKIKEKMNSDVSIDRAHDEVEHATDMMDTLVISLPKLKELIE